MDSTGGDKVLVQDDDDDDDEPLQEIYVSFFLSWFPSLTHSLTSLFVEESEGGFVRFATPTVGVKRSLFIGYSKTSDDQSQLKKAYGQERFLTFDIL